MGYVHDTHMSRYLTAEEAQFSAGTWSDGVASNLWSKNRTAADAAFVVKVPLKLPGNAAALKGAYLKSIDIYYSVATAAMDAVAAALYKASLPAASGSAPSAAAVTTSYDAAHDTAAERLATGDHKLTLTLDSPAWVDEDDAYHVELSCDAAATSVFKYFGARLSYTLRI